MKKISLFLFILSISFSIYLYKNNDKESISKEVVDNFNAYDINNFQGRQDLNNIGMGKEVRLAPIAILIKLPGYSGTWRDDFYFLFANRPYIENAKRINEFRKFKVVKEEILKDPIIRNKYEHNCIIEDINNHNIKATIDCKDINDINEVSDVYFELFNELDKNRKAFVAMTEYRDLKDIRKVLIVNDFTVYQINNIDELNSLFVPDDNQHNFYQKLVLFSNIKKLSEADLLNENRSALIAKLQTYKRSTK